MHSKKISRSRRGLRSRVKIKDTENLRLCVHRTPRHIYAQVIDDQKGCVLVCASTVEANVRTALNGYTGNIASATAVGSEIAKKAVSIGIKQVAFDRSGFKYHGRVKALAEAAREAGLKF